MKARRRARAIVLQCLYELDYTDHTFDDAFQNRLLDRPLSPRGQSFAYHLGKCITNDSHNLDRVISELAPEWPIDQIATIDRNILRLAVYELIFDSNTPPKVAINEAVELAKTFGSESSPRFVNGVLGSLALKSEQSPWLQVKDKASPRQKVLT